MGIRRAPVSGIVLLLGLALAAPLRSAQLTMGTLQGLLDEAVRLELPADPQDLDSLRADVVAVLGSLAGDAGPTAGVETLLRATSLARQVAGVLYHRHGRPDAARSIITQVASLYAMQPGPEWAAAAQGAAQQASKLGTLSPSFSPSVVATTDVQPLPASGTTSSGGGSTSGVGGSPPQTQGGASSPLGG